MKLRSIPRSPELTAAAVAEVVGDDDEKESRKASYEDNVRQNR
jgi:hypothetical protein